MDRFFWEKISAERFEDGGEFVKNVPLRKRDFISITSWKAYRKELGLRLKFR